MFCEPPQVPIQSIVLSRPDRIGDVVISSCCLRTLRRHFPTARIYWLGQAALACLFDQHPALTAYWRYPQRGCQAELFKMFSQANVDCVVHLEADRLVERAAASAGVRLRIGFDVFGKTYLTHALPHTKKQGRMHEGHYCFQLLESLGVQPPPVLKPWIHLNPSSQVLAQRILNQCNVAHPYAVLHVSAHGEKARIPPNIMASIARWLIEHQNCGVVLVGNPVNEVDEQGFLRAIGGEASRIANLCGMTELSETAWILQRARVTVSRDSGPAHLAAAMGAPTLTLFAEPSPAKCAARWRPLGMHAYCMQNNIRKRWWESDRRFAKRNAAKFDEAAILAELQRALNKTR